MVEVPVFHLTACVVWNMGWRLYFSYGQYFWCYHLLAFRMGCSTSRNWLVNLDGVLYRYANLSFTHYKLNGLYVYLCFPFSTTVAIVLVSVLSAIGIIERCKVESGGVYFLLSYVLGSRIAAAVGLLYCFGQVKKTHLHHIAYICFDH